MNISKQLKNFFSSIMRKNKKPKSLLNYDPIYFLLDKGLGRILAVKYVDRYEYRGKYFAFSQSQKWEVYDASLNVQALEEFPDRFIKTENSYEAFNFAKKFLNEWKLTEEAAQSKYRDNSKFWG